LAKNLTVMHRKPKSLAIMSRFRRLPAPDSPLPLGEEARRKDHPKTASGTWRLSFGAMVS